MAKKRPSHTQRLQDEIQNLQNDVKVFQAACKKQDELLNQMNENGENSFLNSPTYIQMKEKIAQLESRANLSELGRISAKGSARRNADLENKILADNKAFLEHNGDTDYFVGITECLRDLKEIDIIKGQLSETEGRIEEYKTIIAERDAEIDRLQGAIAELKHDQSTGTTLPSELQKELDEAIKWRNIYHDDSERQRQLLEKEERHSQKLSLEIENLKLQLSEEPTTENISDEELGTLSKHEIRDKATEKVGGERFFDVGWSDSYSNIKRAELIKRVHYTETISERRREEILDLRKQIQDKRFSQYSQDDAVTYTALLSKKNRLEQDLETYRGYLKKADKRNDELQAKIAEMAAATLSKEEAVQIVEENIAQDADMKKATRRKKGRPQTMTADQIALIHVLREQGCSIRQIAKQLGKSEGTIHRYIHEKQE
jgi:uncharacterized membrane protein|nr:MAG: hypothetical protein [Bacteriophage sp.]